MVGLDPAVIMQNLFRQPHTGSAAGACRDDSSRFHNGGISA